MNSMEVAVGQRPTRAESRFGFIDRTMRRNAFAIEDEVTIAAELDRSRKFVLKAIQKKVYEEHSFA